MANACVQRVAHWKVHRAHDVALQTSQNEKGGWMCLFARVAHARVDFDPDFLLQIKLVRRLFAYLWGGMQGIERRSQFSKGDLRFVNCCFCTRQTVVNKSLPIATERPKLLQSNWNSVRSRSVLCLSSPSRKNRETLQFLWAFACWTGCLKIAAESRMLFGVSAPLSQCLQRWHEATW